MTKRDFKIRRGSFNKGQIERYKDFKQFSGLYEEKRAKSIYQKIWITVIGVIFVLGMFLFGYIKITREREKREFKVPEIEKVDRESGGSKRNQN